MKKKLLVDMHLFDKMHQGSRTYLKGLYSEFIPLAKEFQLYFLAHDIQNLKNEFGEHPNVTYIPLKSHNKFYRLLIEIPQIIKKHKIEYSHFQYISPLFKANKYIVTTHDILFEQNEFKKFFPLKYKFINSLFFKFSAKRADVLLTVSQYSKQKISQLYNIELNKIHVTPNAVEKKFTNIKSPCKEIDVLSSNSKIILYVSRVEPRKNHLNLLKAFIELKLYEQGYKLVLIGAYDFPGKDLLRFIEENKQIINEHVIWKQNTSYENIKQYYASCDLFVFPSIAEGFGIPVLEAMVFNKKMVISNTTAMKDFNLPEEFTFDPLDVEDLKSKITHMLLRNNNEIVDLYRKILLNYSWEKSAEVLFSLLNSPDEV